MDVFAVAVYDGPSETHVSTIKDKNELKELVTNMDPSDFSYTKVYESDKLIFDETALTDLISDYLVVYEENGTEGFFNNVSGLFIRNEVINNPNRQFKLYAKLSLF